MAPARRPRWQGWWRSLLIGLVPPVLLLLLLPLLIWFLRAPLFLWALDAGARRAGQDGATARIVRFDRNGLELAAVSVGRDWRAAELGVTYDWRQLARGKVGHIRLAGLDIRLRADPPGPDHAGPGPGGRLAPAMLAALPLPPPFAELRIDSGHLRWPGGAARIQAIARRSETGRSNAGQPDGDMRFEVTASLTGDMEGQAAVQGRLGATPAGLAGSMAATATLAGGVGRRPWEAALGAGLDIDLSGDTLSAALTLERASGAHAAGPGLDGLTGRVTATLTGAGAIAATGTVLARGLAPGGALPVLKRVPVRFAMDRDRLTLTAAIADMPGLAATLAVEAERPLDRVAAVLQADIEPGRLLPALDLRGPADGPRIGLRAGGSLPVAALTASPLALWRQARFTGGLDFDLPGRVFAAGAGGDVRGTMHWRSRAGRANGHVTWQADLRPPPALMATLARLAPAARPAAPIRMTGNATGILAPNGSGFSASASLVARAPALDLAGHGAIMLDLDPALGLVAARIPALQLAGSTDAWLGQAGTVQLTLDAMHGGPDGRWRGDLAGQISLERWMANGMAVQRPGIRFAAGLAGSGTGVTVHPERLVAGFGRASRPGFAMGPFMPGLAPPAAPIRFRPGQPVDFSLPLAPGETDIVLPAGPVSVRWPQGRLSGEAGNLTLDFDAVSVSGGTFNLDRLSGQLRRDRDGRLAWRLAGQADLAPVRDLAWSARGDGRWDGAMPVTATLDHPSGLQVRAAGRLEPAAGVASVRLEIPRWRFRPEGGGPAGLWPDPALPADIGGSVAGDGHIEWRAGAPPDGAFRLDMRDIAFRHKALGVRGLSGIVALAGLRPPVTEPEQRLALTLTLPGLAPMPLDLTFSLLPGPRLRLGSARLDAFGGRVETGDVLWMPSAPLTARLRLANMELAPLLALARLDGLRGTGRLGGEMALRVEDGRLAIDDGVLRSAGSGRVQVNADKLPAALTARDDIVGLALETLTDFHYDSLDMTLEKPLNGDGRIGVRMKGANPEVLDAHPFDFDIVLTSDFDRLTRLLATGQALGNAALSRASGGQGGSP